MKRYVIGLIGFVILCSSSESSAFGKKTVFMPRSQGLNDVLELVGWQKIMYSYGENTNYGTAAAAIEYTRTFRPEQIAHFLFGGSRVRFSGSMADRQPGDVLADYFGLPADFSSNVCVSPHISNVIIDFDWFQGFDKHVPGLYCMLHVPVVQTKWDLYWKESSINSGTAFYPAGYMSNQRINADTLPQSVTQALQGSTTFGDMQNPLLYGKVFGRQTRVRVAEVQATLGYNYKMPWWHVGCNFRIGAPTGNATNAEFLFEEIVGNGHHWDVGGGVSAHVDMWSDKDTGKCLAVYFDGHVSHLCSSHQKRSFDLLNNGTGSRYMLVESIDSPSQGLFIDGQAAANQYIGKLSPLINHTTLSTKISIGVQADIVLKLMYQHDNFEFDLGYNFWGRSAEKMHNHDCFPDDRFALKGDAQVYGFNLGDTNTAISLNATQHMATIFGGQGDDNSTFANTNADNPSLNTTTVGNIPLVQLNNADAKDLNIAQVRVRTSHPAILLKNADIDTNSGLLPRGITNKLFGHVNYRWDNDDDVDPYIGCGASVELAHTSPDHNSGDSQWAVWIKGGVSY